MPDVEQPRDNPANASTNATAPSNLSQNLGFTIFLCSFASSRLRCSQEVLCAALVGGVLSFGIASAFYTFLSNKGTEPSLSNPNNNLAHVAAYGISGALICGTIAKIFRDKNDRTNTDPPVYMRR